MMIDDYLNQVGEKKTSVLWQLYNNLSAPSPLVLTGAAPAVTFKCKITLSVSGAHTDCNGSVTVNAEIISFTQAGTKTTTTNLTVLPAVTCQNLDCQVKITCIDTGGADIYQHSYADFFCRWEDVNVLFMNNLGAWTQSNAKVVCKEAYAVGDYLRKDGTTTEYPIKQATVVTDLDAVEQFRKYTL
jgi:hypothetical protein